MSETAGVAVTTILTILMIADIFGNSLVIYVIKRNRDMRNPIDYLIVNLAMSDIIFAVFVAPHHILRIIFSHPGGTIGTWLCRLVTGGNIAWLGAASSSVTLVAIAVERFFTIMCPLSSRGKLTKQKLKVIIPCCWILAVAINVPLFMVATFDETISFCKWDWSENWVGGVYDTIWLVLLAFIPLTVMTCLYSRVVRTLWFTPNNDGNELEFQRKGVAKVRKRVTLTVITVSAIFGFCWITGLLIYILSYFDVYMFGSASYAVADTLVMFNSAVNPFVYSFNQRFREKMKGTLRCSCAHRVHTSSEPYSVELANNTSQVTQPAGESTV